MASIGQSIHLNDSMQLVICDISTTPDILQHYWLEHCMEARRHSRLDEHLVLEAAGVDLRQHQHALLGRAQQLLAALLQLLRLHSHLLRLHNYSFDLTAFSRGGQHDKIVQGVPQHWTPGNLAKSQALNEIRHLESIQVSSSSL